MSDLLESLAEMVIVGNVDEVQATVQRALSEGVTAQVILEQGLLTGMDTVGQSFKAGEMFIPEVLLSAQTMSAAMQVLRPLLSDTSAAATGTVVIGTVEGDIHNIGKDLVAMMLEGAGFNVVDLGVDVPPQAFVNASKEHTADIVAMSALLTTTVPKMHVTINALQEAGLRDCVRVLVGGAPVCQATIRNAH
jgi:5-methyltetrahydrofolate--homocysteine methyltransferase